MSPFLQLALTLAIILLAAKLAGYASRRLGQPSVLGELIVGLLLGPSVLDLMNQSFVTSTHLNDFIIEFGELGVLILMFLAGFELHLSDLAKNTRVSTYAGTLGVLLPVALGFGIGELNQMHLNEAVFLGLTLGATSVSISAQTLMELGVLRSRVGLGLLGAAVFDDILVILLLSAFLALEAGSGGVLSILLVVARMAAFLLLSVAFGLWVLPRLVRLFARLRISQGTLTLTISVMLIYGVAAELLGSMAAITGTFIAGLMFARTAERAEIEEGLYALGYSLFVPVFFVSIGLGINLRALDISALWLILLIVLAAVAGKLVGSGLGARAAGFSWRESLQLGAGMVSRGEVGLIVAQVGVTQGLLSAEIFSAIVAMVMVTTLITPPMLRALFPSAGKAQTKIEHISDSGA